MSLTSALLAGFSQAFRFVDMSDDLQFFISNSDPQVKIHGLALEAKILEAVKDLEKISEYLMAQSNKKEDQ